MSERCVSTTVSTAVKAVVAKATNPVFRRKYFLFGTVGALAVVAALVSVAAFPTEEENSTLKCYDSAGQSHPCLAVVTSSQPQLAQSQTAASSVPQPATSPQSQRVALAQPQQAPSSPPQLVMSSQSPSTSTRRPDGEFASWTRTALYQVPDHPENWAANTPTVRHGMTGKRLASSRCRRRLLSCFFVAVEKGMKHITKVAAAMGRTPPGRERL